ncbi:MAG: MerR family transcriptional regulator [Calditrichaeota bacterium]|nr:MerR family transcriptional regulator [Calditrichota bacterium]
MNVKKPFYSIGQVADYFQLPQSVLRYWETVFDALNPAKSPGGSRQYSDEDLKIISEIKHLLYEKGFTIKGANKILNQKHKIEKPASERIAEKQKSEIKPKSTEKPASPDLIGKIILELKEIIKVLED